MPCMSDLQNVSSQAPKLCLPQKIWIIIISVFLDIGIQSSIL